MGTNFYWIAEPTQTPVGMVTIDVDDPSVHIGKRSAAGWYCWHCDQTLAIGGKSQIHMGGGFHEACPECGRAKPSMDTLSRGAAAIELGFAKPETIRPHGVFTCSSFTWAQDPESVGTVLRQRADEELIEDEYGRRYTGAAFLVMLEANCPLQFTDSIGRRFT